MPRPTPLSAIRARLAPLVGDRVELLPRKWERLGDVLVVRGVAAFGEHAELVARAYADELRARIVLEDGGVSGTLRTPRMRRLIGSGPAIADLVQDGIRYRFDAEHVMFSSGNLSERQRMARLEAHGESVVDLFAGIGYFTLPLLVRAGAARVVACELNPVSTGFLRENAAANGVADRLEVREGDCRVVAPRGVAHRVVSGYFPEGHRFLPTALRCLRPEGGILHYHDTVRAHQAQTELEAYLHSAAEAAGLHVVAARVHEVKSFSPGLVHAVLDARLAPVRDRPKGAVPGAGAA